MLPSDGHGSDGRSDGVGEGIDQGGTVVTIWILRFKNELIQYSNEQNFPHEGGN